ncbi:MAG: hypothetical protein IK048_02055 [Clostridia bacterium]|nr:hypothetical protein [Clostridia bacterium]
MTKRPNSKISRQGAIYRVALAGICSALALLLVWLSVVARYGTLGFFAAAGLVLMIPLCKKYYLSAFFAYAVSAGLSVLVGDLASVMGYILYFGPMSLVIGIFVNKNVKWFISLPVQIAYAVGMLALLYFVFSSTIVRYDAVADIKFWVFALVGTLVLVAINLVEQLAYTRIIPRIARVLRDGDDEQNKQSNRTNYVENEDESPFEDFDALIVPTQEKDQVEERDAEDGEETEQEENKVEKGDEK